MVPAYVRSPSGEIFLNQLKRYVKGCLLVPDLANAVAVSLAAGADPGPSPTIGLEAPPSAAVEIHSLIGMHGGGDPADVQRRLSCRIYDQGWRRYLMNTDIPANFVFGGPGTPFILPETIFLEPQQTLQLQFFNRSAGGQSNFRPAAEARKFIDVGMGIRPLTDFIAAARREKGLLYPFWLTANPGGLITIPANGRIEVQFTNTQDQLYLITHIMALGIAAGGAAGDLQELFTVELFDSKNQRALQNSPISWNCLAGNAQFPYLMPTPLWMEPATTMRAVFWNLVTNRTTDVLFAFCGVACAQQGTAWGDAEMPQELPRDLYAALNREQPQFQASEG